MMADEHLEAAAELGEVDLVGAEEEGELRRGRNHVGDAALLCIAEHQPAHARGRHMNDIIAVPSRAIFQRPHQIELVDQLQARAMRALQRTATDDHHRTRGLAEQLGDGLGQVAQHRQVGAQPLDLVGQVCLGADREDLGALLDRLADTGVHQRRFPAQIGADQQDRIGALDARDGRVEVDRGQAGRVIIHAGLTTFEQGRTHLGEQRLGGEHRLAIDQITGDGGDARTGVHVTDRGEGLVPGGGHQLAVAADERTVETTTDQPSIA